MRAALYHAREGDAYMNKALSESLCSNVLVLEVP